MRLCGFSSQYLENDRGCVGPCAFFGSSVVPSGGKVIAVCSCFDHVGVIYVNVNLNASVRYSTVNKQSFSRM